MALSTTAAVRRIRIEVDSAAARKQMDALNRDMKKTATAAQGLRNSFNKLNSTISILAGATIFGNMIKNGIKAIDTYKELGGRIALVADSTVGLQKAQKDLAAVGRETLTSYEAVASLYARLGAATKGMGIDHKDLIDTTTTVANTLRLSGASAQEARSSMLQLSQAMASGRLSGDEYRSISENNVALLDLLSVALGKTRGELKLMADRQELTTDVVTKAILKMKGDFSDLAEKMPVTVGRAFTVLQDQVTRLFVDIEEGVPTTTALAHAMLILADNITLVAKALTAAGIVALAPVVAKLTARFTAGAGAVASMAIALKKFKPLLFFSVKATFVYALIEALLDMVDLFGKVSKAAKDAGKSAMTGFLFFMDVLVNKSIGALAALGEYMWTWAKGVSVAFGAGVLDPTNFGEAFGKAWAEATAEGFESVSRIYNTRWLKLLPDSEYNSIAKQLAENAKTKSGGSDDANNGGVPVKLTKQQKYMLALDETIRKQGAMNDMLLEENLLIGKGASERQRTLGLLKIRDDIARETFKALKNEVDISSEAFKKSIAALERLKIAGLELRIEFEKNQQVYNKSLEWAQSFGDALLEFSQGGKDAFKDMAISILKDLQAIITKALIVIPLAQALNAALKGTPMEGLILKAAGFAKGAAFESGSPQPVHAFASGGIVTQPTLFPMARGGVGLMGEAGAEAVMPLRRTRNGNLGVEASGGSPVNVIVNNNAGAEIRTEEKRNSQGGLDIELYIERTVENYFDSGGGDSLLGNTFGARRMPR